MNLRYLHEFLAEYEQIDTKSRRQILNKLHELARADANQVTHQALKGRQFRGLYKLRVGDYRLIYKLETHGAVFITLGHRREVYR